MTMQLLLNAAIIAVVAFLCERFLPVRGRLAMAVSIGLIGALALIFLPRFLP